MAPNHQSTEASIRLLNEHVMHTYGRIPLAFVHGEGCRLYDAEGRTFLDFVSGLAVNSLGHGHPKLAKTIADAAQSVIHTSNMYYIPPQAELAQELAKATGLDRTFFCNSGAEANEAAIKLARRYQRVVGKNNRYEIITAFQSFHGRSLATVTATGQPKYHEGFDPLPTGFRYVPLNDLDALKQAINDHTAAIMIEPIQGEAGVYPCTQEYMSAVRALCDEHGILLIFDEVQTGVGRTGRFLAAHHFGVLPDIVSLAKGLAGGVPIGCIVASEDVAQGFEPGSHASTFGGNYLSTKAGLTVMSELLEGGVMENALKAGERLKVGLERFASGPDPLVSNVRGQGLLLGCDLNVPGENLSQACYEKGLLVNVIGGKILRLIPPLIVSDEEIDEALNVLEAALKQCQTN